MGYLGLVLRMRYNKNYLVRVRYLEQEVFLEEEVGVLDRFWVLQSV